MAPYGLWREEYEYDFDTRSWSEDEELDRHRARLYELGYFV